MARHNREGSGQDQRGRVYQVEYQPDWMRVVKVTRELGSGRQSTKTLVRNPDLPAAEPGTRVRTHVQCADLGLDFEVVLHDDRRVVRRITVETVVPDGADAGETVVFSFARTLDEGADT
jgi:hypothetical protein